MRLKQHLMALGAWSEDQHVALTTELEAHVAAQWKEAVSYGTLEQGPPLDPALMFDDVYKERTPRLEQQAQQLREEHAIRMRNKAGAA
jgi:2-oxoisovalerate dehydrogenase E1 component alpha subunit